MSNEKMLIPSFEANIIIRGKIELLTGAHIGGSKEKLEIGGVDSIVIRNPRNSYPYLPGSSLKGKLRHLLEYLTGAVQNPIGPNPDKDTPEERQKYIGNVSKDPKIVRLFGIGAEEKSSYKDLKKIGIGRLVVRDAHPDEDTIRMWKEDLGSDANFTEYKAENTIDRVTSAANPRFIERIVEGSKFNFELVYSVFKMEEGEENVEINRDLRLLVAGLRLLEASAIGKSGSRGYGKIKFHLAQPVVVKTADYIEGSERWKDSSKALVENDLVALSSDAFTGLAYN